MIVIALSNVNEFNLIVLPFCLMKIKVILGMLRFELWHYFYDKLHLPYENYSLLVFEWNVTQMRFWHVSFKTWLTVWCWSVLSDICQNQMNQTDILNSLSCLGGQSLHFLSFFLCVFVLFISFMFSLLSGHFEFTRSTEIVRKLRLNLTQSTEETFKNIYNPVWTQSFLLWLANHPEEPGNQIISFLFLTCHGLFQTSNLWKPQKPKIHALIFVGP